MTEVAIKEVEDVDVNVEQESSQSKTVKLLINEENITVTDKSKKSKGVFIFGSINLVFILVLAGGLFYLLQEIKDKQLAQSDEISKDDMREIEVSKQFNIFQSQLGSMQAQIVAFSEELTGKDAHYSKTLADFSQLHTEKLTLTHKELTDELYFLKRQLGKTRGDWLIADAEYLLGIANQRLHLLGDVNTTLMALETVDQRLRESGDGAVFKVREQIVKEIAALRTVSLPDVVGIYFRIQLLKDKVGKLATLLPYAGKPLTESKQIHAHEEQQDAEHGVLDSVLRLLEGYVTVRHANQPVTEIITKEEVEFIRQQLNVKLEMTKIALVQQNDSLYTASVTDAKNWLNSHFTINTVAKAFLTELDKLNNIKIRSQFPDVSQSLKMLKNITKLRIESDKAQMKPKNKHSTEKTIIAP